MDDVQKDISLTENRRKIVDMKHRINTLSNDKEEKKKPAKEEKIKKAEKKETKKQDIFSPFLYPTFLMTKYSYQLRNHCYH